MEPLDPVKNIEGGGKSRRRISSILKAPRRLTGFSDTEQQENVVECPKPVEKRISRRVSFAPANDVLLFSSDAKNASPAQNPLQQLQTATSTSSQNRVQMMVSEDGNQIMGMENLLSAPLHSSQQRDKLFFDIADDYGEKTVMFSTDDAFMDMTHSHTINIGRDIELPGDLPLHKYDSIPIPGERKNMFTMEEVSKNMTMSGSVSTGRNVDSSVEKKSVSTSHEFDDFLSSLFKPSGPSTITAVTSVTSAGAGQIKTQNTDVDKENRAPTSPAVMEKSLNNTNNVGGAPHGSTLCPEDDVCMDMTEAQTGRILGVGDDDNPFQWLFPTQEMYAHLDKRSSQTAVKPKQQPGSKTPGSADLKEKKSLVNPPLHERQKRTAHLPDEGRDKTIMFSVGDDFMDMTRSHTSRVSFVPEQKLENSQLVKENQTTNRAMPDGLNMARGCSKGLSGSDVPFQFLFPLQDMCPQGDSTKKSTAGQQSKEAPGSSKGMEISKMQRHQDKPDMEKTVWFSAEDACMDLTRNHTVNVATNLKLQSHQNLDFLPSCGEKTVRFNDGAAMDMTQCFTGSIACLVASDPVQPKPAEPSVNIVTPVSAQSPYGDTVFFEEDVSMDMTEAQTGRILNMPPTDDPPQCLFPSQDKSSQSGILKNQLSSETAGPSDCTGMESSLKTSLKAKSHKFSFRCDNDDDLRERTVRFSADDACIDVTQSRTVQIICHSQQPNDNMDQRVTAKNVTQSHTAFLPKPQQRMDFLPASGEKTFSSSDVATDTIQSHTLNIASASTPGSDLPLCNVLSSQQNMDPPKKRDSELYGVRTVRSLSANDLLTNLLSKTSDTLADPETEASDAALSRDAVNQVNAETETPCLVSAAMETSACKTMTDSEDINVTMEMTEAQTDCILGQMNTDEPPPCDSSVHESPLNKIETPPSKPDQVQTTSSPFSTERETRKGLSSPSNDGHDADRIRSRKSKQMTLADLQTKIRRLSHMINAVPEAPSMGSVTAPLPQVDHDLNSQDKTVSVTEVEPEPVISEDTEAGPASATTPFNTKATQLMSRFSVGGFKPKLPQRSQPKETSADQTKTIPLNFSSQLNFDTGKRGICDEELDSYEDISETLDCIIPLRNSDKQSLPNEFEMVEASAEDDFMNIVPGQRPQDEHYEKRMNTTADIVEMALQSDVRGHDSTSQTTDSSSSVHKASIRSEATFESSFKPSLLESHLEDYGSDVEKSLEDGTITVQEFFKLFNIDFVIHNARQSVLPGRVLSDTDVTPMDLLKNKYISRPKQMVYETDVQTLTEQVEGLKVRMQDLDKPLKNVNKSLWEEIRSSSEKELKSFGSKLKERNSLFRKMAKVQSHEMKEVLYSNLVQVNLDQQQNLRGTINEADEMIKSLDDCIHELETELAAVEDKGFEDKPSLKSLQEEMRKVTESEAECDRQTAELEMQMKQNSSELMRVKAETNELQSHLNILNMLTEWKLKERTDALTVFTFLNETMYLTLVYEKSSGNDCEQKIADITFKFELDEEESWCHAGLVHTLLSQYVKGEPASWVEKYPTSCHTRKLLHDVSLVVCRCRLLGEEIRLMKMWGGLRLNIVDISCVENQVRILFSSLQRFSKFEVIFGVSLINKLYVLQLESFTNMIGDTTFQQIEEIVALFTPGKKLLTKIVKKINDTLLC